MKGIYINRIPRNIYGWNITKVRLCVETITVQVYTKPVYCTSVHKTSLLVNNKRNVLGQNINPTGTISVSNFAFFLNFKFNIIYV